MHIVELFQGSFPSYDTVRPCQLGCSDIYPSMAHVTDCQGETDVVQSCQQLPPLLENVKSEVAGEVLRHAETSEKASSHRNRKSVSSCRAPLLFEMMTRFPRTVLSTILSFAECVDFWGFETPYINFGRVQTPPSLQRVGQLVVRVTHEQGQVFAFGTNDDGQLGKPCPVNEDGHPSEDYRVPAPVHVCRAKVISCKCLQPVGCVTFHRKVTSFRL